MAWLGLGLLAAFLAAGGNLFVSGSEVAYDLDRDSGPTAGDRAFLNNQFRAALGGDANTNSGTYNFTPPPGSIFTNNPSAAFDDGSHGIYRVLSPNRITPVGAGARAALDFVGGLGGAAAVQYDGSAGGGRVVYFSFPFETITQGTARVEYLADMLRLFEALPRPRVVQASFEPARSSATFRWSSIPGRTYYLQWRGNLRGAAWNNLGDALVATNTFASKTDTNLVGVQQRFYRVVLVD